MRFWLHLGVGKLRGVFGRAVWYRLRESCMAFVRNGGGYSRPVMGSGRRSTGLATALRWVAIPCAAIALATWSVATLAGLHSAATLAQAESFVPGKLPLQKQFASAPQVAASSTKLAKPAAKQATKTIAPVADPFAAAVAQAGISPEKLHALFADAGMEVVQTPVAAPEDPFAKVIADAKLSREKLLAAFAGAGMAVADTEIATPVQLALAMPTADRFHRGDEQNAADADPYSSLALSNASLGNLAYAEVDAGADHPLQLALASLSDDPYGLPDEYDSAALPDSIDLPDAKPDAPRAKPAKADAEPAEAPAKPGKPAKNAKPPAKPDTQALAYARPDKPAAGAFGKLFKSPGAGAKVAVYDISAAVVHMPDGTKLEAHSGIGSMADNPRYVHVKMKGPTPPNTYRLSMREKRFHGVEAVRMTPIGSQPMHGRDGMLAHSYLLRGGREELHGCVAFANYPKFLKAFKQGKVTHMIVVPNMSQLPKQPKVQMVSNIR